jgi:two-component system, NarL family, sensor histidine kinase UhpB
MANLLGILAGAAAVFALTVQALRLSRRSRQLEERLAERNRKLHAFAVELIRAEEDQRSRIARELHDGLGQMMTAVTIELKVLHDAAPPGLQTRVDDVGALATQVMTEMRRISQELRPAILDEMGLGEAVRGLVSRLVRHGALEVALAIEGSLDRLPADSTIACYRLVQEALNNIVRHSGAKTVQVRLARSSERLEVEITDDGKGFDYDPAEKLDGHFGLFGLEERIRAIGGQFEFGRNQPQGTRLHAQLPV